MQERPASSEALKAKLSAIVASKEALAKERVAAAETKHQRMLDSLRQYHGQYTAKELKEFDDESQSKIFINLTAPKTDAYVSKLQDLLFPTDDRNWGIKPTPVPEMAEEAQSARDNLAELKEPLAELQAAAAAGDQEAQAKLPAIQERVKQLESIDAKMRRVNAEAQKRSDRMATLMDDQLKECQYQAKMRDVIEDACKLGIGVSKGPIRSDKSRRRWLLTEGRFKMGDNDEHSVGFERVDPFGFFPAMDVTDLADSDGILQRHMMTAAKLRKLQHKGFMKDALRRLLQSEPRDSVPSYFQDLRSITGEDSTTKGKFYQVWEYSGPLTAEEMRDLHLHTKDEEAAKELEGDIDPLKEIQARIWFCQGEVLKFAIYPYDSGEPMYSVFNIKKDEGSVIGFGIPHICKHAQDMLNAAARQMMKNSGIASGPIIVIDRSQIEPADGDWEVKPFKVFYAKEGIPKDEDHIRIYRIDSHQAELAAIMAIAQKHMDDETGLTALAQGDQGSGVTRTVGGMSILINATNTIFRRVVKIFDDDVTVPNMRRQYDWNMQFSTREEIKGDYEVDARGSSVLLAREMQAQNLRAFALEFGSHPKYEDKIKDREILSKCAQALMIPADEIIHDQETVEANAEKRRKEAEAAMQAQAASGGMSPEELELRREELATRQAEIRLNAEIKNQEANNSVIIEQMRSERAMMELAANSNVKMEEIAAQLQDKREARAHEVKLINVEQFMTLATGQTAGGRV